MLFCGGFSFFSSSGQGRQEHEQCAQRCCLDQQRRDDISLFQEKLPFPAHDPVYFADFTRFQKIMEKRCIVIDRSDVEDILFQKALASVGRD